ncbi:MAG: hypothetical protein GY855_10355, partial [candidate division Zixibacteria bacterium]|nr:hypothetical protein [candidate division Zixibacteria bacterium]
SSGKSINKASDNPAGFVISEQMKAQISGLEQEIQNLEMNAGKLQAADGYLGTLSEDLLQLKSDITAAANSGFNDEGQVEALKRSIESTVKAYNDKIDNSTYGKQALLDGSENSAADISKLENPDVSNAENAAKALEGIDEAISEVSDARGEIGSTIENEIESGIRNMQTSVRNLSSARSAISDTDYAKEMSNMISQQIKLQSATAMLSQGNMIAQMMPSMLGSV